MAAAIACLANEDMIKIAVREEKKKSISWPKYVRDSRGKLVFK
jgi:5-enolpyruvylshikimate-3-phosphate synthase